MRRVCGSHILCCQICIAKQCPNADPKCESCSTVLGTTDFACDCYRRCMRHSPSALRAPRTSERTDDMKYNARVTNVRTCLSLSNSKLDSTLITYFGAQYECFAHSMWYALVCKIYVCVFNVICFGVQNECLPVPCLFAVVS